MSKLRCQCGAVISDTTDNLPYKGYLLPDTAYFDCLDRATEDIKAFLAARDAGREDRWIAELFGPEFPKLPPEEIIHDVLTSHLFPIDRHVYRCPECQRLLVQRDPDGNMYASFLPEDEDLPDVLRLKSPSS